jgi:hypothetical protein
MPKPMIAATAALALALTLTTGCRDKDGASDSGASLVTQTWIEGYRYHWAAANHRLSFMHVGIDGEVAAVALIGGTSTSGVGTSISCDASCQEFTFIDTSDVTVHWARYGGSDAAFGQGAVAAVATAAGTSGTTTLSVPADAAGDVTVLITGLTIDTDHPLSGGDACYIPAYGWHPKHIQAEVASVTRSADGGSVEVEVSVAFEAGYSLEDVRECVDAVIDQAEVPMTVELLAVVAPGAHATQAVSHGMAWELRDEADERIEQGDPDYSARPLTLGLSNPIAGWTALDYTFHAEEGLGRGAYLRDLEWRVDPVAGVASGHAMNESLTQLSGFDYQFEGVAAGVEVTGSIERGTLSVEGLPAQLGADGEGGEPVRFEFTLQDGVVTPDDAISSPE